MNVNKVPTRSSFNVVLNVVLNVVSLMGLVVADCETSSS